MTWRFVTCCAQHWGNFHQVWSRSTYVDLYRFCCRHVTSAVTLTFDPLTLNVSSVSAVTWSNTVYQILAQLNYPRLSYSDLSISNSDRQPFWIWPEMDFQNSVNCRDQYTSVRDFNTIGQCAGELLVISKFLPANWGNVYFLFIRGRWPNCTVTQART